MDFLHFILLVLVFVVGGVAVWFAMRQARLFAELGATHERASRSDAVAADAMAKLATSQAAWEAEETALRSAIEQAKGVANEHENARIRLAAELEKQRALSQQQLDHARSLADEQARAMEKAQEMLRDMQSSHVKQTEDAIKRLASDALQQSNRSLIETAQQVLSLDREKSKSDLSQRTAAVEQLVAPIQQLLQRSDARLGQLEQSLTQNNATLTEQVRALASTGEQLRNETGKLVKALREPHVRGRYGELQLRRVAELAGMTAYCDFDLQASERDSEGDISRPDMVVRMPTGRSIVVDAKTNIQAYLDAFQSATPEESRMQFERFARHVSEQAASLGKKKYWAKVDGSPEFVVMFLPADTFLDAALQHRPDLIELAHASGVVLATPSSLIALLRVVAMGFREQRLAEEAAELRRLGAELHDRAARTMDYAARLGNSLNDAVYRYNEFVGSYQHRLEPGLRKFAEAGLKGAKELPAINTIDTVGRAPAPSALPGFAEVRALPSTTTPTDDSGKPRLQSDDIRSDAPSIEVRPSAERPERVKRASRQGSLTKDELFFAERQPLDATDGHKEG